MALLVVEDNLSLARSLTRGFGEDGFAVVAVTTGGQALDRIGRGDVEAVILDLGLPDMDGLRVIARARELGVTTPILVLTANHGPDERRKALALGADDYRVKPFAYAELLERVRALILRAGQAR